MTQFQVAGTASKPATRKIIDNPGVLEFINVCIKNMKIYG